MNRIELQAFKIYFSLLVIRLSQFSCFQNFFSLRYLAIGVFEILIPSS